MCLSIYGQETYIGKIYGAGNPCITEPCIPCAVLWLETASGNYVLSYNSNWICDYYVIINNNLYCLEDEVEITGTVSSVIDIYSVEHFNLEVETIKKLSQNNDFFCGKIISRLSPPIAIPPVQEAILAIVAPSNFCFHSYILTINNEWIRSDFLLFDGVEYHIDDEVEITGTICAKEDEFTNPYVELEIETIKISGVGIESISIKDNVYYDGTTQNIVIEASLQNQISTFELIDLQGKILLRKTNIDNNPINVGNLPRGVYIYRIIQNNNAVNIGKLIKHN